MEYAEIMEEISFIGFSFSDYMRGEQDILKPQLEALGYTDVRFHMGERDSFGPLSRVITCKNSAGEPCRLVYG